MLESLLNKVGNNNKVSWYETGEILRSCNGALTKLTKLTKQHNNKTTKPTTTLTKLQN